jgi:hypothetical protein
MANKTWTPEYLEFLTNNFKKGKLEDIAAFTSKSIAAINKKASELGLKRWARIYQGAWLLDEDAQLKKLFSKQDNEDIAAILNKTESSVRNRAIILKLKKTNNYWKIWQEKYVLENYGSLPMQDMVKHLKKTKWGIINKYRELSGLRKTGDKTIISKLK